MEGFLTSMEMCFPVHVRRSFDRAESAAIIRGLHHWFTDKTFEEHRSGCAFDYSGEPVLHRPTLLRRIAAQLKGIGWKRSQAVERHFSSVPDMILAPEEEWRRIPGVGKTIAKDVVADIWRHKPVERLVVHGRHD
jgi:ERCC4-type nuclease